MKSPLLVFIFLLACQMTYGQDFITKWSFFDKATSEIKFSALTTDTVQYTWTTSPSGNSGNGSFIQRSPDSVTLSGLDIRSGDTLTINVAADNFNRFYFDHFTQDFERLIEVSQWGDVKWTNMHKAFYYAYNLIITATDTPDFSKLTNMSEMFKGATSFNQDISSWDVSNVTDMSGMFAGANTFNQDIGVWDVFNVTNVSEMFLGVDSFNQDLADWDVSSVTDMSRMFSQANAFNGDISNWDVSNVTDMSSMFAGADVFDQDIGSWDVSNVTDMSSMFQWATTFNQEIEDWDMLNVTDVSFMFFDAENFNQDIGGWDVSSVTAMDGMFLSASSFDRDIGGWDVSSVTDMDQMFDNAISFNQDISGWDVSNVINMSGMFRSALSFNQDIGDWDVSSVSNMRRLFYSALSFNQNLGNWKLTTKIDMRSMLDYSGMDCDHYSSTLVGWNKNNPTTTNVTFGATSLYYGPNAAPARDSLINLKGWTILGDVASGRECDDLVSTDFPGTGHRLTIYPNPTSDQVTIKGDQFELEDIRIINAMGQDVTAQVVIQKQSPAIFTLDLSAINSGVYYIKASAGSGLIYKL